jgi:hypothetical protein
MLRAPDPAELPPGELAIDADPVCEVFQQLHPSGRPQQAVLCARKAAGCG